MLALCGLALSQSLMGEASMIQLNLVFLQNNMVYKPAYPFPIVFAIHNGSDAPSSQNLHFHWRLFQTNPENPESVFFITSDGFNSELDLHPTSIPNNFLLTNGTKKLQERTGKFFLEYMLLIYSNCTLEHPPADLGSRELKVYAKQTGTVNFDLGDNWGTVDIGTSGPCAEPLNAIKIEGYAVHDGVFCPVVAESNPTHMEDCAFSINTNLETT